jgi:shikimate kinase
LSDADIRRETEKILDERTPVYRELADMTIDTAIHPIDDAVEAICRRVKQN